MIDKLIIISNEKFYFDQTNFYCDHIAEKTLPDGLSSKLSIKIIARKSKIQRSHQLKTKNIKTYFFLVSYLFAVTKSIMEGNSKFLILSISPYTFFASLLFIFSKQKPIVYLRSDGHQEYKSILGFCGPIFYSIMFNIVSKICLFISCRKYILKNKPGTVIYPSEITNNWNLNTTKASFKKIKLLYVGRIKVEKGIFSLLKLIKNIPSKITLSIVGANNHEDKKLSQNNVIIYPIENNEKNLIKLYDDNSIFILPSFTEGHPMVLLEALSRFRPVIIFDEIKHVIGNKKGIFVAKRNSSSLFLLIDYISKNYDEIYNEMKENHLPTKDEFLRQIENFILEQN